MNATELVVDTPHMPAPHVRERVAFGSSGLPVVGLMVLTYLGGVALLLIGLLRLGGDDPRTRASC